MQVAAAACQATRWARLAPGRATVWLSRAELPKISATGLHPGSLELERAISRGVLWPCR